MLQCCNSCSAVVLSTRASGGGAWLAGPGAARVPFRVIGLVNGIRLLLMPLLGLGLVVGAYAAGLFEAPDPIYLVGRA